MHVCTASLVILPMASSYLQPRPQPASGEYLHWRPFLMCSTESMPGTGVYPELVEQGINKDELRRSGDLHLFLAPACPDRHQLGWRKPVDGINQQSPGADRSAWMSVSTIWWLPLPPSQPEARASVPSTPYPSQPGVSRRSFWWPAEAGDSV